MADEKNAQLRLGDCDDLGTPTKEGEEGWTRPLDPDKKKKSNRKEGLVSMWKRRTFNNWTIFWFDGHVTFTVTDGVLKRKRDKGIPSPSSLCLRK